MHITLDFSQIYDWSEFHDFFFHTMGFSGDYDHQMDAWIEHMKSIDDPAAGMTKETVDLGESVEFEVSGTEMILQNAPDVLMGFMEAVAVVNQHFMDQGTDTRLMVIPT